MCFELSKHDLREQKLQLIEVSSFRRALDGDTTDELEDQNDAEKDSGERSAAHDDYLTPAERRYLQQWVKFDRQRLAKMASKSDRDRIQEFNQYLANLSEHYDIPKVGPG